MNATTAKNCFEENMQLNDPQTSPEKFNLYNGLANLAIAVQEIQAQIQSLERAVQNIQHHR